MEQGFKDKKMVKQLFPYSMFNQPLVGGSFGDAKMLPTFNMDNVDVNINYIKYKFNELSLKEYFIFINQHRDIVMELFADVCLTENLLRRTNEKGDEELVSKAQQEVEQQQKWQSRLSTFYSKLHETTGNAVLQRDNDTVGEKLSLYCERNGNNVFEGMVAYAASNGEITSSSDQEYVDVKTNDKRVADFIIPYLPTSSQHFQPDKENDIYKKYLFLTRWRSFNSIVLNRILPTEDFDAQIHRERIEDSQYKNDYSPHPSSLLLWALTSYDSSTDWLRLFDTRFFDKAYEDKNIYRRILNQND